MWKFMFVPGDRRSVSKHYTSTNCLFIYIVERTTSTPDCEIHPPYPILRGTRFSGVNTDMMICVPKAKLTGDVDDQVQAHIIPCLTKRLRGAVLGLSPEIWFHVVTLLIWSPVLFTFQALYVDKSHSISSAQRADYSTRHVRYLLSSAIVQPIKLHAAAFKCQTRLKIPSIVQRRRLSL